MPLEALFGSPLLKSVGTRIMSMILKHDRLVVFKLNNR